MGEAGVLFNRCHADFIAKMRYGAYLSRMQLGGQSRIVYIIWGTLVVAGIFALATARWSTAFVSFATLSLSLTPILFADRFAVKLPSSFFAVIVIFIFATLFLGEAFDFYDRYWWWDLVLHAGSAIAFGLFGFLLIFMMFEGNRYAAPPVAIGFVAFCFALSIGATWEIFEFSMDQIFGTNMQKSGLVDTMTDLMIDALGAALGATAGFFYLKGQQMGGLSGVIDEFIELNRSFYKRFRDPGEK